MNVALTLLAVMLFPVVCLALLLWLTHLEETLPRDVRAACRAPEPAPILSFPVQVAAGSPVVLPMQPPVADVRVPAQRQRQAFSRSATASLGGSTNR